MRVLVYIVRHGKTDDSDKNIFRGNRDSKLNRQGFVDAGDLQDFFKDKDFGTIYSSDMIRAIQTGHMIGEPHGKVPHITKALEPWRIGFIQGKSKTEFGPVMNHYIENPEEKIPGGEARDEFEQERVRPLLVEAIEMGLEGLPPLLATSSSVIHATLHMLNGEGHKEMAVKPGGAMMIYLDNGEIKIKVIYKPGKEDSSYSTDKKQAPSS